MGGDTSGVGWLRRIGPFAAIGTTPAVLMLGGGVVERTSASFLPSIIVGAILVLILTALHGIRGQKRGWVFYQMAVGVLGSRASRLASLLLAVLMLGWYAFAVGVGGTALSQILRVPGVAGIMLYSLMVAIIDRLGIRRWNWVVVFSIAATVAFLIWSAWLLRPPANLVHPFVGDSIPGTLVGASMVLGFAAAFALRSPDFTCDLSTGKDVLKSTLLGLCFPLGALSLFGALLYVGFGTWDLPLLLIASGTPLLGSLFLVVGFAASSVANLFSAELATAHLTSLEKRHSFVAVLVVGTGLAGLGFYQIMVTWLIILGILVPPLVLTLALGATHPGDAIWRPWLAWTVGSAAGFSAWILGIDYYLLLGLIPPLLILWRREDDSITP